MRAGRTTDRAAPGKLNEFPPELRRALPAVKLHAGVYLTGINVETPASNCVQDLRRHLKRGEKTMARHTPRHTESGCTMKTRLGSTRVREPKRSSARAGDCSGGE